MGADGRLFLPCWWAWACATRCKARHAVLRNYPVIGHIRFLLEYIRPEIRQYFIESDNESHPFSRQQRSLVYQRAKGDSDKRPFGTQLDVHALGYEWINHSLQPTRLASHDFRVLVGEGRAQPYSASVFNISAMSFGALSANAILALNGGAKRGGFAHDTGEGSISVHHRVHGGDLIWEVGSGLLRLPQRRRQLQRRTLRGQCLRTAGEDDRAQAQPGRQARPWRRAAGAEGDRRDRRRARRADQRRLHLARRAHSAFATPIEMMQFIDRLRELSGGKPTGFKLCIGHPWEWLAICKAMLETGITPDFIVVDGAEGGTGAAPLEFTDHVGTPLQEGLLLVHNTLTGLNLRSRVRIGAAGKVVSAFDIARMMALGADWCNAARGFMFALGCIQAQHCHTGACPTGVTTQDPLRQRALVVPDKTERVYRFHQNTLEALKELVQAAGTRAPQPDPRHAHRAPRQRSRDSSACQHAAVRCNRASCWRRCAARRAGRTRCTSCTGRKPRRTASLRWADKLRRTQARLIRRCSAHRQAAAAVRPRSAGPACPGCTRSAQVLRLGLAPCLRGVPWA